MVTYFDKILYLYPGIEGVVYWDTQYDGKPWTDPYDGLVWENKEIEKPSKEKLDTLNDKVVENELAKREELARKNQISNITPLDKIESSIAEMQMQINSINEITKANHEQIISYIKNNKIQLNDIHAGIFAIKGFMMLMPDIQNSLNKIEDILIKIQPI